MYFTITLDPFDGFKRFTNVYLPQLHTILYSYKQLYKKKIIQLIRYNIEISTNIFGLYREIEHRIVNSRRENLSRVVIASDSRG